MNTHFASPQRTSPEELSKEIEAVSSNPVVSGLLHSVNGLLAILDGNRQIIATNDSFMEMLGVKDHKDLLGLRPGEALACVYAHEEPAGCGTTKYCSTCGAALAIVASLGEDIPAERLCALSVSRGGRMVDLAFLVRSQPIQVGEKKFLLLFLQDVTIQEKRASLERTFYHDVNNMLSMLVQASELLIDENPTDLANAVYQSTIRLIKEVAIQRSLSEDTITAYQPMWNEFTVEQVLGELRFFFENHPSSKDKRVEFMDDIPDITLRTDISLILRVLCNMIINALEATNVSDTVKVWFEAEEHFLNFRVWNARPIPENVQNRVFQRNFSTKTQAGRGVGTYSMKMFGESILGGKVSFTSSEKDGTTFCFSHPV